MIVWRKSSYSGIQDESNCVEVAELTGRTARVIGLRDSKQPDGSVLALSRREFHTFLDRLKANAF
jgi:hypothetical protein